MIGKNIADLDRRRDGATFSTIEARLVLKAQKASLELSKIVDIELVTDTSPPFSTAIQLGKPR